jgi:hypothetical protein
MSVRRYHVPAAKSAAISPSAQERKAVLRVPERQPIAFLRSRDMLPVPRTAVIPGRVLKPRSLVRMSDMPAHTRPWLKRADLKSEEPSGGHQWPPAPLPSITEEMEAEQMHRHGNRPLPEPPPYPGRTK